MLCLLIAIIVHFVLYIIAYARRKKAYARLKALKELQNTKFPQEE